jgi:hypothetical protein
MIMQYLNWPLQPLTSRADGVTLLSVSASTREETFSWGKSTLRNAVKDWKK